MPEISRLFRGKSLITNICSVLEVEGKNRQTGKNRHVLFLRIRYLL